MRKKKKMKSIEVQGQGMKLRIRPSGIAAILLALPVYGVSNGLYELAVCRENSGSFFQKKGNDERH